MPTRDVTSVVHIYNKVQNTVIGQNSPYADTTHLGTTNKIEGWKWDERYWPTDEEFESVALAPSIWDGSTFGLSEEYFQSGYGDNNDLLLLEVLPISLSGVSAWIPKIHTGYFYSREEEWYLFSDWYQTELLEGGDTVSGVSYIDLSYNYKPTYPIQLRRFTFDSITGEHNIDLDVRKVIDFTVSGTESEFRVDTTYDPPRLWINEDLTEEVGVDVQFVVSGVGDIDTVNQLERVGVSNGQANQQFFSSYSPMDPTQLVEVWTYTNMTDLLEWDVVSGIQPFSPGASNEVRIDPSIGSIEFGDYVLDEGSGLAPPAGSKVAIRYTKGLAAIYEPEHAKDYVLATSADTNPTEAPSNRGFIQVSTTNLEPAYILLTVSGVEEAASGGFPTEIGNNVEKLLATVKDANGNVVEGADVVFQLLSPTIGSFGAESTEIASTTNSNGQALVVYNSPLTIDDVGRSVLSPIIGGGRTVLNVSDLIPPDSLSGIWVYQIREDDTVLGIPEGDLDQYYTDYLTEEEILTGGTADIEWEKEHRTIHDISVPLTFSPTELTVGKKRIMLTSGNSTSVDPHDGDYDSTIFTPIYPSGINVMGTDEEPELEIIYDEEFPAVTAGVKGYFVVSNNRAKVQAYTVNRKTNQNILSNEISLNITIPDRANGTFFANSLSEVQHGMLTAVRDVDAISDSLINQTSGIEDFWTAYQDESILSETYLDWFRRTRRGDTQGLIAAGEAIPALDPGLPLVTYTAAGVAEVPVGFRLKSTGITVASMLDEVTWLDPNDHLPSGYWE